MRTHHRDSGRAPRPPSGFSLLEVTITITVLTSATLATSLVLVPIARQSRINREMAVANTETRKLMEQIQATPFNSIPADLPDGTVYPISELPGGQLVITYADPAADPLLIQLQVSWNSADMGSMVRVFDTVRTE